MSTYYAAYMAYENQVYHALVMLAAFAAVQVAGWYLGPRIVKTWKEDHGDAIYLSLCGFLYGLLIVFTFLS